MRRIRRIILYALCIAFLALTGFLMSQGMGLVQPMGIGWGDGTKGRAYSIESREGRVIVRTASAMKLPPAGNAGVAYGVQTLSRWDATGVVYHRFNMTFGKTPQAPVLGRFIEIDMSGGWSLLVSVVLLSLCITAYLRQRRGERDPSRCRNCGYDLRATPDRCPECGLIPVSGTSVSERA